MFIPTQWNIDASHIISINVFVASSCIAIDLDYRFAIRKITIMLEPFVEFCKCVVHSKNTFAHLKSISSLKCNFKKTCFFSHFTCSIAWSFESPYTEWRVIFIIHAPKNCQAHIFYLLHWMNPPIYVPLLFCTCNLKGNNNNNSKCMHNSHRCVYVLTWFDYCCCCCQRDSFHNLIKINASCNR